jgi:hypothetical protein
MERLKMLKAALLLLAMMVGFCINAIAADPLLCQLQSMAGPDDREYCLKRSVSVEPTNLILYSYEPNCTRAQNGLYECVDKKSVTAKFFTCFETRQVMDKLVDAGCLTGANLEKGIEKIARTAEQENKRLIKAEEEKRAAARVAALDAQRRREQEFLAKGCNFLVRSWRWGKSGSGDFAIVEGEVKNLTPDRVENLKINASFYDKDNRFIANGWTFTQYKVLMPDQSSPFKIMANYNPLMHAAKLMVTDRSDNPVQFCQDGK